MTNIENRKQRLQSLVDRYVRARQDYVRSTSNYNETQLRADYLDELLEILGWDVKNQCGVAQSRREVILEDTVEVAEEEGAEPLGKKPDYALRLSTQRKFFVEAKKPRVHIESDNKAAFQVRRYGWNAGLPISVLSNFDKLAIYDCRTRPNYDDNVAVSRLKIYDHSEYVARFDEIYDQLARESVYSGRFDQLFPLTMEYTGQEAFDEYFLEQIERWRDWLGANLAGRNPALSEAELNFLVQRLINRVIFLRICEDRELEKYKTLEQVASYQDLKRLFQSADRRYNSGLFDFAEDRLSLDIEVDGDVLVKIFKELYYPHSPYAFSVVEAEVLSDIYDLFLGREIRLLPNVRIAEKPEVVASNGVVPTPSFVVENIVARTVATAIGGKSPAELANFHVADICCGSGAFLLGAFDTLLNYYLEWYLGDGAEKHVDKIYQIAPGNWRLTLQEKRNILLAHIFGVDIDIQAVEVARFSLLLKLLENESHVDLQNHHANHRQGALPKLNRNIQHGNSLVDFTYFDFHPNASDSEVLVAKINPFDWQTRFTEIIRNGGFDVIVGNPPYVRIQNMVRYSPEEVQYYQATDSPYKTGGGDNFDKYALFIERALSLLRPDGLLGYIVPHKFFTLQYGKELRKLLSAGRYVAEITHFGEVQVFGRRRSTYTCILIIDKKGRDQFSVEHVSDLARWQHGEQSLASNYAATDIGEAPWEFVSPEAAALFARLRRENPVTLERLAHIFVGVQTSADRIYLLRPASETVDLVTFWDHQNWQWTIEKAILRAALLDVELSAFSRPQANTYIIFPYRVERNNAILYPVDDMKERFPRCWEYLQHYEAELKARNLRNVQLWYGYGRTQSLTRFNGTPKLIWPVLSLEPRYAYDEQDILFTGGGNGPYYGLRPRPDANLSIHYLQAILSHPVFDAMIKAKASTFRGGYKSHGKQFVKDVPVRQIDFALPAEKAIHDTIAANVRTLIQTTERLRSARLPQQQQIAQTQISALRQRINRSIESLYGIGAADLSAIPELQAEP